MPSIVATEVVRDGIKRMDKDSLFSSPQSRLSKFIVSLLRFAKPEMLIQDYEWAGAYIKDGQFIGQLVVTPSVYLPGAQQDFDQLVQV
jgi:hypothetical protein